MATRINYKREEITSGNRGFSQSRTTIETAFYGNNVEISPVEHREDFSDCRAEYLADPDLLAAVLRVEDDEPENADHRNENRQQAE